MERFFFTILLVAALSACNQRGSEKWEPCCDDPIVDGNVSDFERRALAGDKDAMKKLSYYYCDNVPGHDPTSSQLATAKGEDADKARYWAEKSIKAGDRTMLPYYVSNYIDLSRDKTLPMAERRRSLIQALWTWQRLTPDVDRGEFWQQFSNEIPETIDKSRNSFAQDDLQDIIFAMRDLDNEVAQAEKK